MFKALSRLFGKKSKKAPGIYPAIVWKEDQTARAATVLPSRPTMSPFAQPKAVAPLAPSEPTAKEKWQMEAAQSPVRNIPAEEICGITPDMNPEEIKVRLAQLYQRHNRAASSLDPKLREEAEFMLETLAGLREKHFGSSLSS